MIDQAVILTASPCGHESGGYSLKGTALVTEFAGEDHETSVVPPAAQQLQSRHDDRAQHYEHIARRSSV